MDFSVLISVYAREQPAFLKRALQSIWDEQTLKPSEIVLVKDGPLSPELDEIIGLFQISAPVRLISLDHNYGLGYALSLGLEQCSHEMVARMDSDDISSPERFRKQIQLMSDHPELDISGTNIAEFNVTPDIICSTRHLPSNYQKIKLFAKKRNPLNHMTVLFKKTAVLSAGNYQSFFGYEDYYLWIRMLRNGSLMANLPENLVYVRVGNDMFARRQGNYYYKQELKLQKELLRIKFLSRWEYSRNIVLRAFPRLLPIWGLKMVYKIFR